MSVGTVEHGVHRSYADLKVKRMNLFRLVQFESYQCGSGIIISNLHRNLAAIR